ncbi:hypothetical protein MUCCIDRAFT_105185 [Mucor lusitanicus CBS 277.49]|uniref:Uncharacterized protein n=1 Tax=Mucor lusitanicus CBS 277.49 TaxID=747725 RepID=A0A162R4G3_MUCCL|nr:hypothetical protein MUCCIDRAFT_105185 [Mucor lusitanicus CBS 277.49]
MSVKTDCSFTIKITKKNESGHNHTITSEESQRLPKTKKALIGSEITSPMYRCAPNNDQYWEFCS